MCAYFVRGGFTCRASPLGLLSFTSMFIVTASFFINSLSKLSPIFIPFTHRTQYFFNFRSYELAAPAAHTLCLPKTLASSLLPSCTCISMTYTLFWRANFVLIPVAMCST